MRRLSGTSELARAMGMPRGERIFGAFQAAEALVEFLKTG
jgi:hypothetical protein